MQAIRIRGGRVYQFDRDLDLPAVQDVLVARNRIAAVGSAQEVDDALRAIRRDAAGSIRDLVELDATDQLVMPGFVNAHYHSYDTLTKGLLEEIGFDVWALHALPHLYGPRSAEELRLRTLVGAVECLRHGITTVQDMCTLTPMDDVTIDTIAAAYREVGIRVVFSVGLRDLPELDIAPYLPADLDRPVRAMLTGKPGDPHADLAFVARQIARYTPLPPRWHWGISPSGPQRSSPELIAGVVELAHRYDLPIFTHVYETKAQAAKARRIYPNHGGSMIRAMAETGLLGPSTTIAHGVWLAEDEIALLAELGTRVALNPVSNMKIKSGVAPIGALKRAGVTLALGADNCSCGDCQNLFEAMKAMCLLASVSDSGPSGVLAADAVRAATSGGAQAVGLGGQIGEIRPGMLADLALIDLRDIAYQPLNSVTRQLVFSDTGRSVDTVIVDGQIVLRNGRLITIDEAVFRRDLAAILPAFRARFDEVAATAAPALPALAVAIRAVSAVDVGLERFLAGNGQGRHG